MTPPDAPLPQDSTPTISAEESNNNPNEDEVNDNDVLQSPENNGNDEDPTHAKQRTTTTTASNDNDDTERQQGDDSINDCSRGKQEPSSPFVASPQTPHHHFASATTPSSGGGGPAGYQGGYHHPSTYPPPPSYYPFPPPPPGVWMTQPQQQQQHSTHAHRSGYMPPPYPSFGWQQPHPSEWMVYPGGFLQYEQQVQHMAPWQQQQQHSHTTTNTNRCSILDDSTTTGKAGTAHDDDNATTNNETTTTKGVAGWNGGDELERHLASEGMDHHHNLLLLQQQQGNDAGSPMQLPTNEDSDDLITNAVKRASVEEPPPPLDEEWADLVVGSDFCHAGLRGDVPDSTLVCMGQFRACGLTQDDRVGKYKNRPLNFVGMCCKYCDGQPGFGRYFPGSYDSFLNGTNLIGIVKHIATDCRLCPPRVRNTVVELEEFEKRRAASYNASVPDDEPNSTSIPMAAVQQPRPRYGSRKRFFSHIWTRLREIELPLGDSSKALPNHPTKSEPSTVDKDEELNPSSQENEQISKNDAFLEAMLESNPMVSIKDRHLVSNTTLVAMAQMKVCVVTEEDQIGRCKDHTLGFKGLCCKHCGGKAGKPGYGRYFPSSLRSLAQADSCHQIIRHITAKCTSCPPEIRSFIEELNRLGDNTKIGGNTGRIKYGSRKIFFRRVWARLHDEIAGPEGTAVDSTPDSNQADTTSSQIQIDRLQIDRGGNPGEAIEIDDIPIPWEMIIGDSPVVSLSDRGLISDAQLAAIAQMDICRLTEDDRIGWFKNRKLGFGGLCCKHCRGRPSFGRYFPNSVRSFAQTTSSQTIISHVSLYCQECPKDIREVVSRLQKKENYSNEGTITLANSMYGSRKVFFDRAWARMHPHDEAIAALTEGEVLDPHKDELANRMNATDAPETATKKRSNDENIESSFNAASLDNNNGVIPEIKRAKVDDVAM